ncbi:UMP kinase [Lentisphaerota bacterium WC36G]|nr:UMP kinase [Lentisphaerae bacterium WC36]
MSTSYKYKRVLLKLSGEALKGYQDSGYDAQALDTLVNTVQKVVDNGVELAIVVGAGNVWRGVNGSSWGMDRVTADYMGMLATVMNGLCLRDALNNAGIAAEVFSAIQMEPVVRHYNRNQAINAMNAGKVCIFTGGTGSPYFTTDTASTLRALEMDCEAVLKATKVDGIYSADPMKDANATRFTQISYTECLSRKLGVMDSTAFSMCSDNNLPIVVFNFSDPNNLEKVLEGDLTIASVVGE